MKISAPVSRRKARIEIIPLIDIIFFLLATFAMLSLSMIKNNGIPVNLPSAVSGTKQDLKTPVTLTIRDNGDVFMDKQQVSLDELKAHLTQLKAGDPELQVIINGDENAYFGKAIGLLDVVRQLDITKVSIQTRPVVK